MDYITEDNWVHNAYTLLMEKYMEKPTDEEKEAIDILFRSWAKSANQSVLNHTFEVIDSHESKEIREIALNNLKTNFPKDKIHIIVEFWITHPLRAIRPFIEELVENKTLQPPLQAACYLMLDRVKELQEFDPDYLNLDNYLNTLNPLLGSLVFDRAKILKSSSSITKVKLTEQAVSNLSIIDLLRLRNYEYLWENILSYPLPFISNLLKILFDENWRPEDKSNRDIYELLLEYIGTEGWEQNKDGLMLIISKEVDGKYRPLTPDEIQNKKFNLRIALDVVHRPDRISKQKFVSRGRHNLVASDLGLTIYSTSVRKSELDGLLHIPIYSSNGVELAEFSIPAQSINHFSMDDDGLYFTVRNKEGLFSFDMDSLAAFLLPVNRHTLGVNDIITTMLEVADGRAKMALEGLNLLSSLHRGREYSLWDLKETKELDLVEPTDRNQCLCTLSIDFDDISTKVAVIPTGECDHEPQYWNIPSVIYFEGINDYIIGDEVVNKDLIHSTQTFRFIGQKLISLNPEAMRIQNVIITPEMAYLSFINGIIDQVKKKIAYPLISLGLTYPLHFPVGFDKRIQNFLTKFNFDNVSIDDKLTCSIVNNYRLQNHRGNVLFLYLGVVELSGAVASLPMPKSRKRVEETRMTEEPKAPPVILGSINSVIEGELFDSEDSFENIINDQLESEKYFHAFKIFLRNLIVKGTHRGLKKDKIEQIILIGPGSTIPKYLDHVKSVFPKLEIIIDDDDHTFTKGLGLMVSGQSIDNIIDRDYLLRISNEGIIGYNKILERGERIRGKSKLFEIRGAFSDKVVIDCWTRIPILKINEDAYPMKDNESLEASKMDGFDYFSLHRELIPIGREAKLHVEVALDGQLSFFIEDNDKKSIVNTLVNVV